MPPADLSERPRERLLAHGPNALTDAELVALLIGAGYRGRAAVDVARETLAHYGSVSALLAAPDAALAACRGLGPARVARLKAGVALARRALVEDMRKGVALTSPEAVRDYLRSLIADLPHETFVVLFLDSQHRLIAAEEMFRGTLAQTSVYPREVVKAALAHNAAAVIFAHNHPSGLAEPSRADELLTRNLKDALELIEVKVLDHFIVAGHQAISFAERGLL